MQEFIEIMGMIIKTVPIGEFDRRLVILTKERGKITAFVKGARRPSSRFIAATNLFCFGTFKLYEGRNSYTLADTDIINFFEELRIDFEGAYYGMYFLEIADYYTRENNDEREMLKLLFQSLKALCSKSLDNRLVRYIYELKSIMVNGEYPGITDKSDILESTIYTLDYIQESSIEKLYTFSVTEDVLDQLGRIAETIRKRCIDYSFKSLSILTSIL